MSNQFEWKTEDDVGWVEQEPTVELVKTAVSSRRNWLFLAAILAVLVGFGGWLYRQAQIQVQTSTNQVESEIELHPH